MVAMILPLSMAVGQPLTKVMPGTINFDRLDTVIRGSSIDAALTLSLELTGNYLYVPVSLRDSVLATQNGGQHTIISAARSLGAAAIVFATVSRIVNLVRAEVVLASGSDFSSRVTGIGYSTIRFMKEGSDVPIAEPSILTALQRAIAVALDNPELYANADTSVRVFPTKLLSVGGVEFISPSAELPPWQLFKEKTVSSYDLAQNIVFHLTDNPDITILDIDSRDTMFATAGFHLIANDRPVSSSEIQVLRLFEVSAVIIGSLERIPEGARLTLMYCRINSNDTYTPMRTAFALIVEDTKEAFHNAIKECMEGLF
ncbi:MAG: hypothetical protein HYX66_08365 [Ignavibacteria bacterium]|nr:hypothetical protein [Ignavibacteria bacterium]